MFGLMLIRNLIATGCGIVCGVRHRMSNTVREKSRVVLFWDSKVVSGQRKGKHLLGISGSLCTDVSVHTSMR